MMEQDMARGADKMRSLLDNFDEHNRDVQEILNVVPRIVKAYIETLKGYEEVRLKWKQSLEENTELSAKVSNLQKDLQHQMKQYQDAQFAIAQVRKLLDRESRRRKLAEKDRDYYEAQVGQLSDILKDNINKLSRETKEQLALMKKNRPSSDLLEEKLETVTEFETTGSMISDLSFTRDEEDHENMFSSPESRSGKRRNGNRDRKARKKRRSASAMRFSELMNTSDRVVATTTVTVDGSNIHATAVIESKPESVKENNHHPSAPPPESDDEDRVDTIPFPLATDGRSPLTSNLINTRAHNFQQKASLKSETCNVCNKRIRFSAMCCKCRDCKTVCHFICKDKVPLPCVANGVTPGKSCTTKIYRTRAEQILALLPQVGADSGLEDDNKTEGLISDYTPIIPPMVPAIVVHCINEVEARGLSEVGIYRVSGSEREVRLLVEKFRRGKGLPNLSQVMDIHVICSTLKDFFRSLKDSLTTRQRWHDLARAIEDENEDERKQRLCRLIHDLPQPNRDTLAYLILHLKRVAEIPECKMPYRNLSNIFGPTVIGYSTNNIMNMYEETRIVNKIMEELLNLSTEFWESFIKSPPETGGRPLIKTPSGFLGTPTRSRPILKLTVLKDPEEDQVLRDPLSPDCVHL